MAITDQELQVLVALTGSFEAQGDPYEGVSGDFDGQGISCGVLQWNIGQNSLQPLVRSVGQAQVEAVMPVHGAAMWQACTGPLATGLAIVRGWQAGKTLRAVPKRELRALMGSAPMRAAQAKAIRATAREAEAPADAFAAARGADRRSLRELAFFFDMETQNGSPKGLTFADVRDFREASGPGRADDLVCDWLLSRPKTTAGFRDGERNAALWRNAPPGVGLDLLIMAYLRSQKSTERWRVDVLNRKGTIALKQGWVHKTRLDLTAAIPD